MAGAYCHYCGTRCFVLRILPDGRALHMATCTYGAINDLAVTGYTYLTARNPREQQPLAIVATGSTSFHGATDWDLDPVEEGQHDNPDEWLELCLLDPQDPQPEYRTSSAILRLTTAGAIVMRDQLDTLIAQRGDQT